jgi:23S rRNA-/tRNA-specific pseudouridylate synthase
VCVVCAVDVDADMMIDAKSALGRHFMKSSSSSSHRHRVVVVTAATGRRRRRTQSRRRPNLASPARDDECPFCGANAPSKSHLAICVPDALNPRGWNTADACESAAVRESVLRRHGRRSRAYEVCSARFGWDEENEDGWVRVRSAVETRDAWRGGRGTRKKRNADGKDDDDDDDSALLKLVVDIVRREVRATPLSVEAVTTETLEILRDDADATFVNKPARTPCTPTSRLSGDASVTAMVLAWWGEEAAKRATTEKAKEIAKSLRRTPYAAHRLDLETSGVFVLCKTADAAKKAQRAFESGTTTKVYLAVCRISSSLSPPPLSSSKCWTLIDYPLVKEEDPDDAATSDGSSFRVRAVFEDGVRVPKMKSAQTFVRVLAKTSTHALVQARPRTGRTHQIRVHLAAVGLPIVCDALYDDEDDEDDDEDTRNISLSISRHALHAHALKFPDDDDDVVIADPPNDFVACLRELGLFVVADDGDYDDDTELMKAFLRQSSLEAVRGSGSE